MSETPSDSQSPNMRTEAPWRDAALVILVTFLSIVLAARFQLSELLYSLTRHFEYVQLDELPIGMLVFSTCLIGVAVARSRHAQRELEARRIAESRLERVLAQNRELAQQNLRIQESERKHLARELHDEFGQYLNVIKLDAVAIRESAGRDAVAALDAALAIIRAVDHVHEAVGQMIARLRPVGLDELGLVAAIEHCVEQWRERQPATRLTLELGGCLDDLPEALTLTVYRLIQEGLTNVFKHASARHAVIRLERLGGAGESGLPREPDELRLTVSDDGRGMQAGTQRSRFGLEGMRERVEMAQGRFELASAPGQGLRFTARLPVRERA
jgi:signal transduction histidine kinase